MGRTEYDVREKQPSLDFTHEKRPQTTESLAADILSTLYAADNNDEHLVKRLQDTVHETGWYDNLAAAVLDGLEKALKKKVSMGEAMEDAYEKATQLVEDIWKFAKEHPVFFAVVALGILVILAPWAIEAMGFAEFGPVEGMCIWRGILCLKCRLLVGSLAALWQSRYAGYVPKGSLFSFFQRLGMVWRRKLVASPAMAVQSRVETH
jgi:hypothetical protein